MRLAEVFRHQETLMRFFWQIRDAAGADSGESNAARMRRYLQGDVLQAEEAFEWYLRTRDNGLGDRKLALLMNQVGARGAAAPAVPPRRLGGALRAQALPKAPPSCAVRIAVLGTAFAFARPVAVRAARAARVAA